MRIIVSKLIIITFLLSFYCMVSNVEAKDFYVRPSGGNYGAKDGSDWNNAFDGFPLTLVRGSTYYVAGGNYTGGVVFDDLEAGSTYIYIKKANAAANSSVAGWSNSFSMDQAVFSNTNDTTYGAAWVIKRGYYDFDGITGAEQSGHGIKLKYGSMGHTNYLIVSRDNPTYEINISHIEFELPGPIDNNEQSPMHNLATNAPGWRVSYCYAWNFNVFTKVDSSSSPPWIIEHNYFKNQWSSSANHGELVSIVGTDGLIFRYNIAENATNGTGGIIALGRHTLYGDVENVEIYGNVFFDAVAVGDGLWGVGESVDPVGLINWKIYNNTVVNNAAKISTGKPGTNRSIGIQVFNNLYYGSNVYMNADSSEYTVMNNYYNNCTFIPVTQTGIVTSSESPDSLFQNYSSHNYRLKDKSGAVNAAKDLGSPYNLDMDGHTRISGQWDIGAFELVKPSSPNLHLIQ